MTMYDSYALRIGKEGIGIGFDLFQNIIVEFGWKGGGKLWSSPVKIVGIRTGCLANANRIFSAVLTCSVVMRLGAWCFISVYVIDRLQLNFDGLFWGTLKQKINNATLYCYSFKCSFHTSLFLMKYFWGVTEKTFLIKHLISGGETILDFYLVM